MEACFPSDKEMVRRGKECHPKPENRLAQQPKSKRFAKTRASYREQGSRIVKAWPAIASKLSEAGRFQVELKAAALQRRRP